MRFTGPDSRRYLRVLLLATVLSAGAMQGGYAQSTEGRADLTELQQISTLSVDNQNPTAAFSPDGSRLFVAWDGLVAGKRRILLRERVADNWLNPVVVDANPAGENTRPVIAVDSSGTPHIAWISTSSTGQRTPVYARRLSREKNSWYQQLVPYPNDSARQSNCDVVNLQPGESDRPWLVWQHGYGNIYNIAVSRFNDSGTIVSDDLTPGSTTHNLYPEIFFNPDPIVYWYMWETDQFYLIASRYDSAADEWKLTPPENLELVPAANLPDLFSTSPGPLGAIWYDRHLSDESAIEADRIFLGLQTGETKGRGEVIGPDDGSSNDSVAATSVDGRLVTVWVSETYEAGQRIIMGIGDSPASIETVIVSPEEQAHNANPRVAASRDEAAVVWEQEEAGSMSGSSIVVRSASLD